MKLCSYEHIMSMNIYIGMYKRIILIFVQSVHNEIIDCGGAFVILLVYYTVGVFYMSCKIKFRVGGDPEARYVNLAMSLEEYQDADIVCSRFFMHLIKIGYSGLDLLNVKIIRVWYEE